MSNSIDDLIEEKIEQKLGLYETNSARRSDNEIRDSIQEELEKRPKTTHELRNAVNATKSTIENHCGHLEKIGVIAVSEVDGQEYWKLAR
jgi:predicted transcriptional regulator